MSEFFYKEKYLKYKKKYLLEIKNQIGKGFERIPNIQPEYNSWIFMPLILLPFNNMRVCFPNIFYDVAYEYEQETRIKTSLGYIEYILKEFYKSKNINLNDHITLDTIGGYRYDDQPNCKHLIGTEQERLLNDVGILTECEAIAALFVNNEKTKNEGFVFDIKY